MLPGHLPFNESNEQWKTMRTHHHHRHHQPKFSNTSIQNQGQAKARPRPGQPIWVNHSSFYANLWLPDPALHPSRTLHPTPQPDFGSGDHPVPPWTRRHGGYFRPATGPFPQSGPKSRKSASMSNLTTYHHYIPLDHARCCLQACHDHPQFGNIRDSPILCRSALHEGAAEESNTLDSSRGSPPARAGKASCRGDGFWWCLLDVYNNPWMLGYPWFLMIKYRTNIMAGWQGWWFESLWKMMEFVSWDDDIPTIWKNIKHVPNHQPVNQHWNRYQIGFKSCK